MYNPIKISDFEVLAPYRHRFDHLSAALKAQTYCDLIAEFGVYRGHSINHLAKLTQETIHGFDSFEGLPEDWKLSDTDSRPAGTFACDPPPVPSNVILHRGLFNDVLPEWVAEQAERGRFLSFAHIDCDLAASALDVLAICDRIIKPGAVIAFDELGNWPEGPGAYPNWEHGEWWALKDWELYFDRRVKALARDNRYCGSVLVL